MSPENQWLDPMYSLLKWRPFLGDIRSFPRGVCFWFYQHQGGGHQHHQDRCSLTNPNNLRVRWLVEKHWGLLRELCLFDSKKSNFGERNLDFRYRVTSACIIWCIRTWNTNERYSRQVSKNISEMWRCKCLGVVAFLLWFCYAVSSFNITHGSVQYFLHTFHLMRLQTWRIASWCLLNQPIWDAFATGKKWDRFPHKLGWTYDNSWNHKPELYLYLYLYIIFKNRYIVEKNYIYIYGHPPLEPPAKESPIVCWKNTSLENNLSQCISSSNCQPQNQNQKKQRKLTHQRPPKPKHFVMSPFSLFFWFWFWLILFVFRFASVWSQKNTYFSFFP